MGKKNSAASTTARCLRRAFGDAFKMKAVLEAINEPLEKHHAIRKKYCYRIISEIAA